MLCLCKCTVGGLCPCKHTVGMLCLCKHIVGVLCVFSLRENSMFCFNFVLRQGPTVQLRLDLTLSFSCLCFPDEKEAYTCAHTRIYQDTAFWRCGFEHLSFRSLLRGSLACILSSTPLTSPHTTNSWGLKVFLVEA